MTVANPGMTVGQARDDGGPARDDDSVTIAPVRIVRKFPTQSVIYFLCCHLRNHCKIHSGIQITCLSPSRVSPGMVTQLPSDQFRRKEYTCAGIAELADNWQRARIGQPLNYIAPLE